MSDVTNFVDEKTSRKIIAALCSLEFNAINKLAEDSGVPVNRLLDFVDETEKITQLDKGKLILHLLKLMDMGEEEIQEMGTDEEKVPSLKQFQQRKA